MPIYDYKCRACGEKFELLVLKGTVPACPSCKSKKIEQLISAFAVSSAGIRQTNLERARSKMKASKTYRDKQVAEVEEIKKHDADHH
jgi:putative FmdB family regulatory protein